MKRFRFLRVLVAVLAILTAVCLCACTPDPTPSTPPPDIDIDPGSDPEPTPPPVVTEIPAYLKTKADKAGRLTLEKTSDCPADFTLSFDGEGDIRILQLTDTQMIDPEQVRRGSGAVSSRYSAPDAHDVCLYDIVRDVVAETDPDLILITGDYVYGEYDDNGTLFREQTEFFDELGIWWAPIFGNHDNDSDSELSAHVDPEWPDWYPRMQCNYFEASEYCLFRTRATISGYSNYSIALKRGEEIERTIYMLDTHGSTKDTTQGLKQAQMDWFTDTADAVEAYAGKPVPSFVGIHIPMWVFTVAAQEKYGYDPNGGTPDITIPENPDGDFGHIRGKIGGHDRDGAQFAVMKEHGVDAILTGHEHKIDSCILYEGVWLVFGTKSSTYASYSEDMLGGTLFTMHDDGTYNIAAHYWQAE